MFEKESEEYIKKNNLEWELECNRTSPIGEVKQAFQEGAEFGYNKAKEEMKEQIEKMKCCYNCSKDCGSIDRRICFENKMKDWTMKEKQND